MVRRINQPGEDAGVQPRPSPNSSGVRLAFLH